MTRHCAQCEALKVEVNRLKEELAAWASYADPTGAEDPRLHEWRKALNLPESYTRILLALCDRAGRIISPDTVLELSRTRRSHKATEDLCGNVRAVMLHHIRRRLAEAGFSGVIEYVWGSGYRISKADAARIEAMVEAAS